MKYFKEKLYENYLVLKRGVQGLPKSIPLQTVRIKNLQYLPFYRNDYIDCVKKYMEERENESVEKVLLVSDNRNMIINTAALLANSNYCYDEDIESAYNLDDYREDIMYGEEVLLMDFSSMPYAEKKELLSVTVIAEVNDRADCNQILFMGTGATGDWSYVLQNIAICDLPFQYVEIHPNQLSNPVVQRLIYEYNFEILELPKLKQGYYQSVMDFLLKDSIYRLSDSCQGQELLRRLQKKRGVHMSEEDVAALLDMGVGEAMKDQKRRELNWKDFKYLISEEYQGTRVQLDQMTGLNNVKEIVQQQVALIKEQQRNPKLKREREHMVFYGGPGTGKTTCAKLLADVFDKEGIGNGTLVVATRKDLIGEYVGHTAPKVAKKFEEAKGGILFVDEAGFFLNRNSGGFVEEAIKEFVRYMEEYTDVTVIFGMYPEEAKEFINLDDGLSSRIKQYVEFNDYTIEELVKITHCMFEDNGYEVNRKCDEILKDYITVTKSREKNKFGNAREMRKLVDMTIKMVSLRNVRNNKPSNQVTKNDLREAMNKLQGVSEPIVMFGFHTLLENKMVRRNR